MKNGYKSGHEEGIKEGKKEGIEQKAIEVATKLLQSGVALDFISEITELSIEEIKTLKSELNI